ncbi:MAG: hypothetical protein II835_07095, partial [Fibrobacter sp.]|nr:hypothetical protein [Fibrobacter sp.]
MFSNWIGPVSQMPEGTLRRPPPLSDKAFIALAKASVFRVPPSPTPPKSVTETSYFGILGCATS